MTSGGAANFTPKFDLYSPDLEWGWSPEFPGLAGVYRDPAERSERLHFADRGRALEAVGLAE